MLAAMAVRLLAVIWSKGFIHSDDHFDSISVAYEWLVGGFWGEDGFLRWKHKLSDTIGRFPLYNLTLFAIMKLNQMVGISSLNGMMYSIRFSHALLSLLPVWAGFKITRQITRSDRWAIVAALALGFNFAMPFLGVRNLIEIVGGDLWIVAVLFLYRYQDDKTVRWLYLAGLFSGLAWMIRFQLAFAIVPVPFVLWFEQRSLKPAAHYSLAVIIMLLLSGLTDLLLLGRFGGSTITNLTMNTGLGALYNTIPLLYVAILLIILVPPFSLLVVYLSARISFLRAHLMLVATTGFFILVHSLHPNQQERFVFPVLNAAILLAILSLWWRQEQKGYILKSRTAFRLIAGSSLLLNFVLLGFFTFAYGHRGMIEPLVRLESTSPKARVLFMQPSVKRWAPIEYAGEEFKRYYVRDWADWEKMPGVYLNEGSFDYFLLYPKVGDDLDSYADSVQARFGPIEPVFEVEPSTYDWLLHAMNPGHNDDYAAFVYRPVTR